MSPHCVSRPSGRCARSPGVQRIEPSDRNRAGYEGAREIGAERGEVALTDQGHDLRIASGGATAGNRKSPIRTPHPSRVLGLCRQAPGARTAKPPDGSAYFVQHATGTSVRVPQYLARRKPLYMRHNHQRIDSDKNRSLNSDATTVDPELVGGSPVVVRGLSPDEHVALRRRGIARAVLADDRTFPPPSIDTPLSGG